MDREGEIRVIYDMIANKERKLNLFELLAIQLWSEMCLIT